MHGPSEQERRRKTALDVFVSNQTETIFVEYIFFFFFSLINLWVSLNTQKEYIGIYKKAMQDIKRCNRDLLPWTAVV